jgi:hypothetical protein
MKKPRKHATLSTLCNKLNNFFLYARIRAHRNGFFLYIKNLYIYRKVVPLLQKVFYPSIFRQSCLQQLW